MPKQYNIRWKQSDSSELSKAVKNFNAKISRLEKKYPEIKNVLPEKVTVAQMKELISTRQDLNRELNSLRRFSARDNVITQNDDGSYEGIVTVPGNDYNLKTTKWQKEEMTRRIATINRKRKERYEMVAQSQVTDRGKPVGYTVSEVGMKSVDENALKPMKAFTRTMSRSDLNYKFNAIRKESQSTYWNKREMQLKQNVKNGILANYNARQYKNDLNAILDAIDNMDFKTFYAIWKSESGIHEIVSPPPGADLDSVIAENLEALKSIYIPNYK